MENPQEPTFHQNLRFITSVYMCYDGDTLTIACLEVDIDRDRFVRTTHSSKRTDPGAEMSTPKYTQAARLEYLWPRLIRSLKIRGIDLELEIPVAPKLGLGTRHTVKFSFFFPESKLWLELTRARTLKGVLCIEQRAYSAKANTVDRLADIPPDTLASCMKQVTDLGFDKEDQEIIASMKSKAE